MLLPTTYFATLMLMILSMVCWGSWANTQKLAGPKWRFELFYFDYAIGVFVCAALLAFTFGSFGYDGFSTMDSFSIAGRKQMVFAFAGGIVFNLANMLLVAGISLAGLAVAFPVAIGLALIVGAILNYIIDPNGNPWLLFGGIAFVLVAIILDGRAYSQLSGQRFEEDAKAGKTAVTRRTGGVKGLIVCLVSGVLMGLFFPIVQLGAYREPGNEAGLAPYPLALIFTIGILVSTPLFNLFFMNLPVEGMPIGFLDYFKGTARQHSLGLLGGAVWSLGTVSNFVAASAQSHARVGPAVSYAFGQGATLVSVLWGLFVWREFAGAGPKTKGLITAMVAAFVVGLAMVSVAPVFVAR